MHFILSINRMEKGTYYPETPTGLEYPLDLHLAIKKAQRGDMSFDELRSLFVNWAKKELQSMPPDTSERGALFSPESAPDSSPTSGS
jgi:hypothetical protein